MQHCISTAALHHPITWVFLPPEAFSFHILPMGQAGWWEGESPTPPPPPPYGGQTLLGPLGFPKIWVGGVSLKSPPYPLVDKHVPGPDPNPTCPS